MKKWFTNVAKNKMMHLFGNAEKNLKFVKLQDVFSCNEKRNLVFSFNKKKEGKSSQLDFSETIFLQKNGYFVKL